MSEVTTPESNSELCTFEYAIIRIVPRVEREEFLNAGVLLSCATRAFLQARIEVDWPRLQAFAPEIETTSIEEYLNVIPLICAGGAGAGPIGQLSQRARFHWLVAPRSTIIQCSPVHLGRCHDLNAALEHLLDTMVRPPLRRDDSYSVASQFKKLKNWKPYNR